MSRKASTLHNSATYSLLTCLLTYLLTVSLIPTPRLYTEDRTTL